MNDKAYEYYNIYRVSIVSSIGAMVMGIVMVLFSGSSTQLYIAIAVIGFSFVFDLVGYLSYRQYRILEKDEDVKIE